MQRNSRGYELLAGLEIKSRYFNPHWKDVGLSLQDATSFFVSQSFRPPSSKQQNIPRQSKPKIKKVRPIVECLHHLSLDDTRPLVWGPSLVELIRAYNASEIKASLIYQCHAMPYLSQSLIENENIKKKPRGELAQSPYINITLPPNHSSARSPLLKFTDLESLNQNLIRAGFHSHIYQTWDQDCRPLPPSTSRTSPRHKPGLTPKHSRHRMCP